VKVDGSHLSYEEKEDIISMLDVLTYMLGNGGLQIIDQNLGENPSPSERVQEYDMWERLYYYWTGEILDH
jgi:hypothetical protein